MSRIAAVVALATTIVGAGTASAQEVGYGARAGISLADLAVDPDTGADSTFKLGLVAGGFVSWPLGDNLSIEPEVLFTQKGQKVDALGVSGKVTINYLEVPISAKYAFGQPGGRRFFVLGGPSIGFKLSAEASATFGGEEFDDDIDEAIETVDFGVTAGAGMSFGRFSVDGRYTLGLSNLNVNQDLDGTAKNRVISILAGVRF